MTSPTRLQSASTGRHAEQLSLFESTVPERFRLDDATRRRGLRHAARIRAQLEARYPSPAAPVPRSRTSLGARSRVRAA